MCGCGAPSPESHEVTLRVALSADCQPPGDVELTLISEGDFASGEASFVPLSVGAEAQTLPPFRGDTRAYRLEARGDGFFGAGHVSASPGGPKDVLVLPFGRVCAAGERTRGGLASGHAAPLGDSELLWLGAGTEAGSLRMTPGEARIRAPRDPLFVPRAGATVTGMGDSAWVVGGGQSDAEDAPALASYERFDPQADGFEEVGRLDIARAGHAAVRTASGALWVAGGRDGGTLLDSLEQVGEGRLKARLARPSDQLVLLALDDGHVVALDFARGAAPDVQHFDSAGQARLDAAPLPVSTAPSLAVALPGGRLLAFEVDDAGLTTGRACLRFDTEGDACLEGWLTSFAGLSKGQAVALRDGRALLVGERAGAPTLRIVDVGRRVVEAHGAPFVPAWAGLLGDGSVGLVGDTEVAVVREDAWSRTTELPATLLAPDAPLLALDSVDRWRWEGLTLVSLKAGAQAHVAAVRLQDLALEVRASGPLDVRFGWDDGESRTLRIRDDEVDVFGTPLPHDGEATVTLERDGDTFTVQVGDGHATRTLHGRQGHLRVSLQARQPEVRVEALHIERR